MNFFILFIQFKDLDISASNKDSLPLQSGIFKYVDKRLKGVNKVGPNLYNIVNKEQGKADYTYSKTLASLSGKWTYEELNKFLYKPKLFYKGTKMNYAGLSKTKDRADLIAWLRTKSDSPVALPQIKYK